MRTLEVRDAVLFAIFWLLLWSCAPSRAIAQERTEKAWFEQGNCLIVDIRKGRSAPAVDESLCGRTGEGSIGTSYGWLPAYLIDAFDTAEIAACGQPGCASRDLPVRVYIRWGQVPVLQESASRSKVVLFMTTALIDVVESSLTTVFQDLVSGDHNGLTKSFKAWLQTVDRAAGRPCSGVPTAFAGLTRRPQGGQEFSQIRTMGQVFYRFVFAHELGHVLRGADCGAGVGAEALTLEKRCDRLAFEWMSAPNQRMMMPPLLILPAVGLDHYTAVLDPLLARMLNAGGGSLVRDNSAVQWGKRADAILSDWDTLCRAGQGNADTVCRSGWKEGVEEMRDLIDVSKPDACVVSGLGERPTSVAAALLSSVAAAIVPAAYAQSGDAVQCLRLSQLTRDSINWVATGDPPIVKVDLQYRNICDRPIQCNVSVVCGTVVRSDPRGSTDWRPGQQKSDQFKLMPDQFYDLAQTLQWYADEQRMPRLQFPNPPADGMQYAKCEFAGDAVSRPTDPAWCAPISQILTASRGGFQSIKGSVTDTTSDNDKIWSTSASLPGAKECEVDEWSGDLTPTYTCTLAESKEAGALEARYRDTIQQVRNCLGSAWDWNELTKDRPTTVKRASEASRGRWDGTVAVVLTTSKSSGRSSLEVNVDPPE
jgi:hypothetical protein